MKRATVIIGANFGDEGKGLFTDWQVSQSGSGTLVVRHNGGAQAGHTVITPEGKRHVFGHFGSGTFCGATTFLSRHFVCNPLLFLRERAKLERLGLVPDIAVDILAPVTTPYDMMINQIVEDSRGVARHGSCGVGFGETLERQEQAGFRLTVRDMSNAKRLRDIRDIWMPRRLAALGITTLPDIWKERIANETILEGYLEAAHAFLNHIHPVGPHFLANWPGPVVFEGAQGLLLDQNSPFFPHVTRSSTGLTNAVALAEDAGIEGLDVIYATRSYLTRHGAGPLPGELPDKPYPGITDPTNAPNLYQGHLRFAWLNLDLLETSILQDLASARTRMDINPCIGMSCMDQIEGEATFTHKGCHKQASPEAMLDTLRTVLGFETVLASYGPTRACVTQKAGLSLAVL